MEMFQDNDANHHLSREWRASPFGRNNTWCDTVYGVSQCREINRLIKNKQWIISFIDFSTVIFGCQLVFF
ncbi:hypothetical protein AFK69_04905 [Xenorhabdus sp. GDc328]|nr:hypothetical protein AFK69_04905 [Xenorhabdus sp. GDc328]